MGIISLKDIGEFYNDLNNQAKDGVNYWRSHQQNLNNLFDMAMNKTSDYNKAIILGAGNCNDIPLINIANKYNETTLLDIDKGNINHAKSLLPADVQSKIKVVSGDLTSTYENNAEKFMRIVLKGQLPQVSHMISNWVKPSDKSSIKCLSKKYSLVVSSTVSTQLIAPFVDGMIQSQINSQSYYLLKPKLAELFDTITQRHIAQIQNLISKYGIAIITSEQYGWGHNGDGGPFPTNKYINNPEEMLDPDKQKILEMNRIFISGRITESLLSNLDILHRNEWIWQFNNRRFYLVKGWIVQKKNK
jgi:hypothetical protein